MELDWEKYSEVADRFQYKARYEDRDDLRHSIIVRLAEVAGRNGDEPLTEGAMVRVASYVVMEYWHAEKRNGRVISLNNEVRDWEGDSIELLDTIADDRALNLESWVDSKSWLLGCPRRLIEIAKKKATGIALTQTDHQYLWRYRKREMQPLAM
ncbi:MAG: hypothetical protein PHI12_14465 [Dehalococcoidales bacterium]|nr:hypothetical protein [Dehalococcoidales bacterium]